MVNKDLPGIDAQTFQLVLDKKCFPILNEIAHYQLEYELAINKMNQYMNEEDKYYIPLKEDIRIGYKCETFSKPSNKMINDNRWHEVVITQAKDGIDRHSIQAALQLLDRGKLRTPYLTKEDIEAELIGWESFASTTEFISYRKFYEDEDDICLWVSYNVEHKDLHVRIHEGMTETRKRDIRTLYHGSCPSINEFRTIIKLLGI